VNPELDARLRAEGLKERDARHVANAFVNGCHFFVTLDTKDRDAHRTAVVGSGLLRKRLRLTGCTPRAILKVAEWRLKGANAMKLRQMLRQRDSWLHLEFNVAVTVVVAIVLATVVSKFIGASLP
jgi:hypothetical protein